MQFSLLEFDSYNLLKKFIKKILNKIIFMSKIKIFFDWQHKNNKSYTCLVCFNKKDIIAFQAFIPQSNFDNDLPSNQLFLSLWISKDKNNIGAGLGCYKNIIKMYKPEFLCSIGIDSKTFNFHKWQKFNLGLMNHHVIISPTIKHFNVIKYKKISFNLNFLNTPINYKLINEYELLKD